MMTGLGAVLAPRMSPVSETREATPVLPGFSESETNSLKSATNARSQDSQERLFTLWKQCAESNAAAALLLAEQNPRSGMAWARSAQAQWAAGLREAAVDHAQRALAEVAGRHTIDGWLDAPAVYAAVQILFSAHQKERAAAILAGLPRDASLTILLAMIALDGNDINGAAELLEGDATAVAASLRGYVALRRGDPHRAIRELRYALELCASDVDSMYNLSLAFGLTGSTRKALRYASLARRLAPGRKDVALSYLKLLAEAERWDQLRRDLQAYRDSDLTESPDYVVCQVRESLHRGESERATALMEKAKAYARRDGKSRLVQEITANQATLEWAAGRIERSEAWRRMRVAAGVVKDSIPLLEMLADVAYRRADARILREYIEGLPALQSEDVRVLGAEARIAYLECRFDDALTRSMEWTDAEPDNLVAASIAMLLLGHIGDDWTGAARIARRVLKLADMSTYLANQTAFTLALAGDCDAARAVLNNSPTWDHRLEATSGLVAIGAGDVSEGLSRYRKALSLAERDHASPYDPSLMALFQAMALRRLGLHESNTELIRAAALPAVELPDDWHEIPMFAMLRQVAHREGWSWPIAVP